MMQFRVLAHLVTSSMQLHKDPVEQLHFAGQPDLWRQRMSGQQRFALWRVQPAGTGEGKSINTAACFMFKTRG
jgi:hypothetical protein